MNECALESGDNTSVLSHSSREYLFVGNESEGKSKTESESSSDIEPKLEESENSEGISKMIEEAQMEEYITDYYQEMDGLSQNDIIIHNILYLGSATVSVASNALELSKTMSILRTNCADSLSVMVVVRENELRLLDSSSTSVISTFLTNNICFWGRDEKNSCVAINFMVGESEDPTFQCHVFQCEDQIELLKIHDALEKIKKKELANFKAQTKAGGRFSYKFDLTIDLWEEDGRGSYQTVARDRSHFKLRTGLQRKVVMVIRQLSPRIIKFQRCFGLLMAHGKSDSEQEMHLVQQVSMDRRPGGKIVISGHWNPLLEHWNSLNVDSDNRMTVTIAADVVLEKLQEPIRIVKEIRVRVFPVTEKFWNPTKPKIHEEYVLTIMEKFDESGSRYFEKESLVGTRQAEKEKVMRRSARPLSSLWRSGGSVGSNKSTGEDEEVFTVVSEEAHREDTSTSSDDDDFDATDDEPLLSGTGQLNEVFSEEYIVECKRVLQVWSDSGQRPDDIIEFVRQGIPDSLRAQLWELLIGPPSKPDLLEHYAEFIEQESPQEQVILWDVKRTFPAHEYFKELGGEGQNALHNVSKAYSLYDEEVGYVQGLSFLIAVFLLHVPEEKAYTMLVDIMHTYKHRDLFKDGFKMLHQTFYILDELLKEQIEDLYWHLNSNNVEMHMFASQWFLTLFTVRFPLPLVYKIMDFVLCSGCDVTFQFALAFLEHSKEELLRLNFEGIMKYFRVGLPKKYLDNETNTNRLIEVALGFKISKTRLQTLKDQYDPVTYLQRSNDRLQKDNLRLEQEIVNTQVNSQEVILEREEQINKLAKEGERMEGLIKEHEEEIGRLKEEESRVKEMWRESTERADSEKDKRERIITEYKQVCKRLEENHESDKNETMREMDFLKKLLFNCELCSKKLGSAETNCIESVVAKNNTTKHQQENKDKQLRELEAELIATKLALAEERNRADELELRLNSMVAASERPWYKKALNNSKR